MDCGRPNGSQGPKGTEIGRSLLCSWHWTSKHSQQEGGCGLHTQTAHRTPDAALGKRQGPEAGAPPIGGRNAGGGRSPLLNNVLAICCQQTVVDQSCPSGPFSKMVLPAHSLALAAPYRICNCQFGVPMGSCADGQRPGVVPSSCGRKLGSSGELRT